MRVDDCEVESENLKERHLFLFNSITLLQIGLLLEIPNGSSGYLVMTPLDEGEALIILDCIDVRHDLIPGISRHSEHGLPDQRAVLLPDLHDHVAVHFAEGVSEPWQFAHLLPLSVVNIVL